MRLSKRILNNSLYTSYISQIESNKVEQDLSDEYRENAMDEKLNQFTRNDIRQLVSRHENGNIIGSKWIFQNKTGDQGTITRNKASLVAQVSTQVEGIDFDVTLFPIDRLESIRILLTVSCTLAFKLYQRMSRVYS